MNILNIILIHVLLLLIKKLIVELTMNYWICIQYDWKSNLKSIVIKYCTSIQSNTHQNIVQSQTVCSLKDGTADLGTSLCFQEVLQELRSSQSDSLWSRLVVHYCSERSVCHRTHTPHWTQEMSLFWSGL